MTQGGDSRGQLALTGLGGGFFSGLTGVGGGAIMVPLMTGLLRMRQHTAHGTSLVIIIFAAAASALVYEVREGVRWEIVGGLLPGSLLGAYLGARLVQHLPAMRLRQLFGAFVFLVGLRLLAFPGIDPVFDASGSAAAGLSMAIGLTGGLVCGALGVGGGAVFVPALVLLMGVDQHEAQGVSLCVIVGAAVVGAWTHARHGSIDGGMARRIVPLAIPAGMAGALAASWLDGRLLQVVFAVVLSIVGTQMFVTATRGLRRLAGALPAPADGVTA